MHHALKNYEEIFPVISQARVQSDGTKKVDTSLYSGSGGVTFIESKLGNNQRFEESLNANIGLALVKRAESCPSYFMSNAGLYTIGAIQYHKQKEIEKRDRMIEKLRDVYERLVSDEE